MASPNARAEFGIKHPTDSICKQTPHCALVVTVFRSFVPEKHNLLCPNNWKKEEYNKNSWKTPCLGGNSILLWVWTTSCCSTAVKCQAKWGSSLLSCFESPSVTQMLPGTSFCRALVQGRLVVGTEQPLSPIPQSQPSTSMFLVFPKPQESRKSQSLTNLSLS